MPGFYRLRMHTKCSQYSPLTSATAAANSVASGFNSPVAFIEFKDAASASSAMNKLQGKFLLSSDRGSIHIEYAKSKMLNDLTSPSALSAQLPQQALPPQPPLMHFLQ